MYRPDFSGGSGAELWHTDYQVTSSENKTKDELLWCLETKDIEIFAHVNPLMILFKPKKQNILESENQI